MRGMWHASVRASHVNQLGQMWPAAANQLAAAQCRSFSDSASAVQVMETRSDFEAAVAGAGDKTVIA